MSEPPSVDLAAVADLYSRSLREHGPTPMGVGWRDEPSQRLRFDKLLSVVEGPGATVNELGCGYGALAEHMVERGLAPAAFAGWDISAEMLEAARARLSGDWVRLVRGDRLDAVADYSFTSGIFNVRYGADEETWRRYMEATIAKLAAHSRRGFAFNALTTYVDFRREPLFYADPLHFFDLCRREHGRHVTLLHDYPLYEWTITVRVG